ncbi:uncharacterized protein PHACADRAFT_51780, partial [Phanerochaete carnosa HHB-10118-sp]
FRRPLGPLELSFYWDACFNGVAVLINRLELEATQGLEDELLAEENVRRAWLRMKQRFPLLGATVEELPGSEKVEFILRESALHTLRPGEFNILDDLETLEDALRYSEKLQTENTVLDNNNLARVWIARQKGSPRTLHIFIPIMHFITDGIGNAAVERELCQEISRLYKDTTVNVPPLPARIQALLPVEAYSPAMKLSLPRRRWRSAIAKVIDDIRMKKLSGGQTLPMLPPVPVGTPPRSRTMGSPLSAALSRKIAQGCHALHVTLSSALPVLSEIAFARVLHRLRSKGQISDEDWEHRRRQPMHFAGPINYRPYLDRGWLRAGGWNEMCIAISYYNFVLPFMPTSSALDETGAPSFSALLSPERFLARARIAVAEAKYQLTHPLIDEFHLLLMPKRSKHRRATAMAWRARQVGKPLPEDAPRPSSFEAWAPYVVANGGASLGNRDLIIPHEYPLPPSKNSPKPPTRIHLRVAQHDMRCCTGELYLGAITTRGVLAFFSCIDENTFDTEMAREWTEEVKNAALYYL